MEASKEISVGNRNKIGVLGATSLVGEELLHQLQQNGYFVSAFSRRAKQNTTMDLKWEQLLQDSPGLSGQLGTTPKESINMWICAAPIWILPEHFELMYQHGVRRVLAISSTSLYTKKDSPDPEEQIVARRLLEGELRFRSWAEQHEVQWIILRPTMIYGRCRDKNVAVVARFIRRFGFFPLAGHASGLRQPISVEDVASACVKVMSTKTIANRAYDISGREILSYRDMIIRIFTTLGRPVRVLVIPLIFFRIAITILHLVPRYRHLSYAMVLRMNSDLIFRHDEASRDFGFNPSGFCPRNEDVSR